MYSYKQLPPEIEAKGTLLHNHRQTIERLQEQCQRLEDELAAYSSSVAPVRKCPQELLVMIFKHYLSNKPFLIRHLLLVCKTWHAIAVGTPSFWTEIPINIDTREVDAENVAKALRPRIEASLLHSQPLPLDIRLDLRYFVRRLGIVHGIQYDYSSIQPDAPWNPSHVLRFLQSFVGRDGISMVRWKSLDVIFPFDLDKELRTSILGLFVGPSPHLTKLHFSVGTSLQLSKPIFPDLSSLNSLDIDSVELLNQINAPFNSLENLSIACWCVPEFQLAQLHRFTSLTALTIRPTFAFPTDDSVSIIVSLPLLKEIKFRRVSPPRQVQFDLPLLSSLHIEHPHRNFSIELPIMSPRSVSLCLSQSDRNIQDILEALIRHYGSMETLRISEYVKVDLKVVVEKLRREGSLSRTFNLVRVVSDGNQETELRVWPVQ